MAAALVRWRRRANAALDRHLGVRVVRSPAASGPPARIPDREPGPGDRLLPDPVFIISSVRSGSTLLRVLLDSHDQIHAPHETHFRRLLVELSTNPVQQAMEAFDLNEHDLEHLLWDRLLHRELVSSGKQVLVEKTPSNAFVAARLAVAWPQARFVYLIRHPGAIARSWHEGDPDRRPMPKAITHTLHYMRAVERARRARPGLTVRYEDLVADPAAQTQRLCAYLGVRWDEQMLDYGSHDHGEFVKGIGDWRGKIRSGGVQSARPLPEPGEVPEELHAMTQAWGYA